MHDGNDVCSLTYAWLSDGTKVSAKADDGSGNGVVKRYLGSFVFTTSGGSSTEDPTNVESVAWDEGRIFFEIPGFSTTIPMLKSWYPFMSALELR